MCGTHVRHQHILACMSCPGPYDSVTTQLGACWNQLAWLAALLRTARFSDLTIRYWRYEEERRQYG